MSSASTILCDFGTPSSIEMSDSCSTTSLNYWRKFFHCANADIFQVIRYAILVASADCPNDFLSWRDQITEILYTCWPSCERTELQTPEGVVEDNESDERDQKESKESKSNSSEENEPTISNELSTNMRPESSNQFIGKGSYDQFEALTDEIEEECQTVGEVLRIKGVLTNWQEESEKVICESLRRLQLMELSIETLGATDIGRAVNGLHEHKSKPIRHLAQTLTRGWKLLAEEWVNAAKASQEATPDFVDPSPAEEETWIPSELDFPPLDVGALLATQTAPFEFSKFFDEMDDDGNLTSTGEFKKKGKKPQQKDNGESRRQEVVSRRKPQRKPQQKDNGESRRQEVVPVPRELKLRELKPMDATSEASKSRDVPSCFEPGRPSAKPTAHGNNQQRQNLSGEVRGQEVPRAPKPINATYKTSKPHDSSSCEAPGRPSGKISTSRNTKLRHTPSGVPSKPSASRKDVSKESDEQLYREKLEVAKRKLQDGYREATNAKKQRTIQVMELKDLPRQGQNKQQLKVKPGRYFKRRMNVKSR